MEEDTGGRSSPRGNQFNTLSDNYPEELPRKKKSNKKRSPQRDITSDVFSKQQKIEGMDNGPRYLVLSRVDKSGETMENISPFFIKKAIDCITPNVTVKRIRDGKLLLRTTDRQQAQKLLKQTTLGGTIQVQIESHGTLNTTKGVISCHDFKFVSDEEILEGLKDKGVIAIRRLNTRRNRNSNEKSTTIVLTFNLSYLPTSIDVGFYNCYVKQYIPMPMRCISCLKFGHLQDVCKGVKTCGCCAQPFHEGEECAIKYVCVNCSDNHHTLSRECPIFNDEYEIQKLRVSERISLSEARRKRRIQTPNTRVSVNTRLYAAVTKEGEQPTDHPETSTRASKPVLHKHTFNEAKQQAEETRDQPHTQERPSACRRAVSSNVRNPALHIENTSAPATTETRGSVSINGNRNDHIETSSEQQQPNGISTFNALAPINLLTLKENDSFVFNAQTSSTRRTQSSELMRLSDAIKSSMFTNDTSSY